MTGTDLTPNNKYTLGGSDYEIIFISRGAFEHCRHHWAEFKIEDFIKRYDDRAEYGMGIGISRFTADEFLARVVMRRV